MTDQYDTFRDSRSIVKAIMVDSIGIGYDSRINETNVRTALEEALTLQEKAECWFDAYQRCFKMMERLKAAKTLCLDLARYENDVANTEALRNELYVVLEGAVKDSGYVRGGVNNQWHKKT